MVTTKSKQTGSSSARAKAAGPDAITLLKEDHVVALKLLRALEKTESSEGARRSTLLEQAAFEIEIHAAIEEDVFYPAFRAVGRVDEDEKLFFEAAEEHALVHQVLPALRKTDVDSELFSARAKVLMDLVEHHAEEEESELFPRVRELMDRPALRELGRRLQEAKAALKERMKGPEHRSTSNGTATAGRRKGNSKR